MASISSPGIGSGLDINSIVSQLVAVERVPITKLQTEAGKLQTQLSVYGKLQSSLATLRDAAAALGSASTWGQTAATSSDATALGVASGAATPPGRYTVQVQRLAAAQSNVTGVFASADALVGEGTLHIQLGQWSADQSGFTPKAGATTIDIPAGPPAQSLAQLRDAINTAHAGVTASILTDANGARLVLRSTATGAANGFRVGVTDADSNHADFSGLSALAFDPSAGILTMAQSVAAANAAALLNGTPVESQSNTLTDVIDGLSLTLLKETTSPVTVNVASDQAAKKKAVEAFASAYNDVNKMLAEQTRYDAASRTAGALQGDGAAVAMRQQLRNLLGATSGAAGAFTRLSEVGFDVQRDGSIKLDTARLDRALTDLPGITALFANLDLAAPAKDGMAVRLRRLADQLLGVDGSVSTRSGGLRERIERNRDRQEQLGERVGQIEKRLRAQYTALDGQMAQLNSLSGYVTQQITQYNKNSG